jgi:hypothetical protein
MVYTDKNKKSVIVNCDCKCGAGIEIDKFEDENYTEYFISVIASTWYTEQNKFYDKLINRIRAAWNILMRGTHLFQEICMTKEDFNDLKNIIKNYE